jgi:hypothetical protein
VVWVDWPLLASMGKEAEVKEQICPNPPGLFKQYDLYLSTGLENKHGTVK